MRTTLEMGWRDVDRHDSVVAMETARIIYQLTHSAHLPRAALEAASECRSELAPVLIDKIEATVSRSEDRRPERTPVFFAFHLLGAWKDKSAYRPLSRLLRCPPDELDVLIGEATVETSHRVMAAVFDGDLQPILDIILDPQADEFVRARMCETLAMLVVRGQTEREPVARFLRNCFMNLLPQSDCFVWVGWQSAIAMLGLSDLKPFVKKAFARGFINQGILGFDTFETDLDQGVRHPGRLGRRESEFRPFDDVVDELSSWYGFSDEAERERQERANMLWPGLAEPASNPFKYVGRNDPCPCGSGKKFKKCCLE
ncbi:MAG: DUF1186 domain-containing protein [Hyphomicrobiales bacterium]|nr:DUF1186 domain-containing protein [Hyphomicrobiales bacterium]